MKGDEREREGKRWRRGKEGEKEQERAGKFNKEFERGEKCRREGEEAWIPACPLFVL